ncbi:hypothetical protein KKF86_08830 [bacterium]|nr:hypothetical protein [bacterium]
MYSNKTQKDVSYHNINLRYLNPITNKHISLSSLFAYHRHELTSRGIRVTKETLVKQMEIAGLEENLNCLIIKLF